MLGLADIGLILSPLKTVAKMGVAWHDGVTNSSIHLLCLGGEIGRRTGLKILGLETDVPVRFRS